MAAERIATRSVVAAHAAQIFCNRGLDNLYFTSAFSHFSEDRHRVGT
jgi:hypothetical protein